MQEEHEHSPHIGEVKLFIQLKPEERQLRMAPIIQLILEHDKGSGRMDINERHGVYNWPALGLACVYDNVPAAKVLLNHQAALEMIGRAPRHGKPIDDWVSWSSWSRQSSSRGALPSSHSLSSLPLVAHGTEPP